MRLETYKDANKDLLKAVTKPLTKVVVQVKKTLHFMYTLVQLINIFALFKYDNNERIKPLNISL